MMIYVLSLFLLLQFSVDSFVSGFEGDVTPKDPVVMVGATLNLTCSLGQQHNASDIYFTKGTRRFSNASVTVLSEHVARLSREDMQPEDTGTYHCYVAARDGPGVWINSQYVQVGYPPDSPSNLTCISYNQENMTCTWNTGRTTYLKTTYELLWSRDGNSTVCECPRYSAYTECIFPKGEFFRPDIYYINLNSYNALGRGWLNATVLTNASIVKPNPVRNLTAFPVIGKSSALTVQWLAPKLAILLGPPEIAPGLVYRLTGTSQWNHTWVRILTEFRYNESFSVEIGGLTPYTDYNISVAVQPFGGKYWSDVMDTTALTAESIPAAPPGVTSGCFQHDIKKQNLFVYWQEIPRQQQNGMILNYKISWNETSVTAVSNSYLAQYPSRARSVPEGDVGTWTLIDNASPRSLWIIKVNAETRIGRATRDAVLTIAPLQTRPGPPRDLYIEVSSDNVAYLYWKPPVEREELVVGYTIYWCLGKYTEFGCQGNLLWQKVPRNVTSYELHVAASEDVRRNYRFAVSADSDLYSSGMVWPHVKCNYLYDKVPDIHPVGFSLKENALQKERSLDVKWLALDCTRGAFSKILNYTIRICEYPEECKTGKYSTVSVPHQDKDYVDYIIEGLKPATRYGLAIQAVTTAGGGRFTSFNDTLAWTQQSAPSLPPAGLRQKAVTSNSVTLAWEPSPEPNGNVSKYQLYELGRSSPVMTTRGDVLTAVVDNLEGWKRYQFMVTACTDNGTKCSELSPPLEVNTTIGAPGVIDNFKVQVTGSTGQIASVTWDPPPIRNGPITGYVLHINSSAGYQEQYIDTLTDMEKYQTHDGKLHSQVMPCTKETVHMAINFSIQAINSLEQRGPLSHVEETYMCQLTGLPDGVVGGIVAGCIIGGVCIAFLIFMVYRTSAFCKKKLTIPPEEIPELPPPISIDDHFDYDSGNYNNNSKFLMSEIDEGKLGFSDLDLVKFMKQNSIDSGIFTPSPVSEQERRFSFNSSGNSAHGSESSSLDTIQETGEGQEEVVTPLGDQDYLDYLDEEDKMKDAAELKKLTNPGKQLSPVRSISSDSGNGSSSDYYYSKMAVNSLTGQQHKDRGMEDGQMEKQRPQNEKEKRKLCTSVIPVHQPEVIVAHAQLVLANGIPLTARGGQGEDNRLELHSKSKNLANVGMAKTPSTNRPEIECKEESAKKSAQKSTISESSSSGMGYSQFGLGEAMKGTDADPDVGVGEGKDTQSENGQGKGIRDGDLGSEGDQESWQSDSQQSGWYRENSKEDEKVAEEDEEEECAHANIPLLSQHPSPSPPPLQDLSESEDCEAASPLLDNSSNSTCCSGGNFQDGCQVTDQPPPLFSTTLGSGYVTQEDIITNGITCPSGYVANC
ncbi:cytokine receptor isoform X2 [Lingula anatina]|uniref:Cytokine receptor isoform X2 n=1 Tax=Lingula anatina TaxID=7574 RepID=A0A1S3KDR3_LINAN|nr:cytokine receptor isoform X2 [Lingula anatina]|eukprot:XP_013420765.1 cytokine receptor isoform X2 [Lingula anatina]